MKKGTILTTDEQFKTHLSTAKTIAIIGMSAKLDRDSNMVGRYLQSKGFTIIPINPVEETLLGEPVFKSLDALPEPADIVVVFRKSEAVFPHAEEAVRKPPKVFWMQLGVENEKAADLLVAEGIDVVMDKCVKVEHGKLFPL